MAMPRQDFGPIRQIFARGVCGIFGSEAAACGNVGTILAYPRRKAGFCLEATN